MIRRILSATFLSAMLASQAPAFDIHGMSEAEKDAFGDAVRSYLLENPQVLREAIEALQAHEAELEERADAALIAAFANEIFEDDHSYVGGNPDGDITLVEFIDYRCNYCRRAHPEVAELISSDGGIRKIIKEFPILGQDSVEASRFAISVLHLAGPEAYKRITDTLIAHRGTFDRPALAQLARTAGLDAEALIERMDTDAVTDVIRANHALAQAMEITGTPTFVVGDRMLRGYLPLEGMRDIVADIRGQ